MIDQVTNAGALPALERLIQFAGRRHEILAHNIANISTPEFRPADVSVAGFQRQLAEAVDERRERTGNRGGELDLESTREVAVGPSSLVLTPRPTGDNILFHDGNDRDPERMMQSLVENFMTFRSASELLRGRLDLLRSAIREQV